MTRLAIVSREDCKSKECNEVCIKYCPVNLTGYKCIILDDKKKALISESLCTGCGICIKKCNPWDAIKIINLPEDLDKHVTHRYGPNLFKLHRLPYPRKGKVIGLVGQNGSGKSTSLKILTGEITPNFGIFDDQKNPWDAIKKQYRGSELQKYFQELSTGNIRVSVKPQTIDKIPKVTKGVVKDLIHRVDERGIVNMGEISRSENQWNVKFQLVTDQDVFTGILGTSEKIIAKDEILAVEDVEVISMTVIDLANKNHAILNRGR